MNFFFIHAGIDLSRAFFFFFIHAGIDLSRAYVKEFRHNDISDLERILDIVAEADRTKPPKELNRRFIIVEGLYQNTGADP